MSLMDHLATGATTTCRAWSVVRRDGVTLGFTDHDRDLSFDGITFRASSGMTASALQQATGLSVDNSEAAGALSDASIREADVEAGRFDGAEVRCWQVNWADVLERAELFRGSFGEIVRVDGAFRAELRGLSEALNRVTGQVFHAGCSAVLGDARCRVDTTLPAFSAGGTVAEVLASGGLRIATGAAQEAGWFEGGLVEVLDGAGAGLKAGIRSDRPDGAARRIDLWAPVPAPVLPGDQIRLVAGCDRRAGTCRVKFGNFLNFRGFPHVPGEDWLSAYPAEGKSNDGGGWTR